MHIGILTGGGDCPGLNAVIRACVKRGHQLGCEFTGIKDGWRGLIDISTMPLTNESIAGLLPRGGTILGTSRTNPFKMTGVEILEQRDLPGKYIPIVEVIGRESWVDGKRILWGLVRPAKDSLRMYNYFASTITEKMGLAPNAPFIGAVGQFATAGDRWRKANRVNYAVLEYDAIDVNGNAVAAPQRQGATPMEVALLNQMQVIEHDVQTSLGMFKAATGESESQQSGRAILALQRESDTGTYHFGANLGVSIRHTGRIIVDMIPHYYDTKRIVRIIGDDGEIKTAQLDPEQDVAHREVQGQGGAIQSIYNPGVGKYDVSITVGPS